MRLSRSLIVGSAVLLLASVVGAEVVTRLCLGLGTPPLFDAHPTIEYMYRPNQVLRRFGNEFRINAFGMRADSFSETKPRGEYRILVFGDSVVNGGAVTDQRDLATSILQRSLEPLVSGNVVVGNVSAGSWGPHNWLEYVKAYGFFGADAVVLVISSHDSTDIPTFEPLDQITQPTSEPVSAITEALFRYLLPWISKRFFGGPPADMATEEGLLMGDSAEESAALDALTEFLQLAQANVDTVQVFLHWEKTEIERKIPFRGFQRLRAACGAVGISPVSLEPYFSSAMEAGTKPYRDHIHPSETGQGLIARAMLEHLRRVSPAP